MTLLLQSYTRAASVPREPQAVPVPSKVQLLTEASIKTPSKWVRVWLSQGIQAVAALFQSHENI